MPRGAVAATGREVLTRVVRAAVTGKTEAPVPMEVRRFTELAAGVAAEPGVDWAAAAATEATVAELEGRAERTRQPAVIQPMAAVVVAAAVTAAATDKPFRRILR